MMSLQQQGLHQALTALQYVKHHNVLPEAVGDCLDAEQDAFGRGPDLSLVCCDAVKVITRLCHLQDLLDESTQLHSACNPRQ